MERIATHKGFSREGAEAYFIGSMPTVVKLGHVSNNAVDVLHCPFCGSGSVVARSDGTIECTFCSSCFTVTVAPQFSAFPQTADNSPYMWPGRPEDAAAAMPGTPGADESGNPFGGPDGADSGEGPEDGGGNPFAAGGDEGGEAADDTGDDDDDEAAVGGNKNPFAKKSAYRTASGTLVTERDYLRHLAMVTAHDPEAMKSLLQRTARIR